MKKFMIRGFQTNDIAKVYELVENAGGKVENIVYCVGIKMFRKLENAEKCANGDEQIIVMF